jgi:hypothetical protein
MRSFIVQPLSASTIANYVTLWECRQFDLENPEVPDLVLIKSSLIHSGLDTVANHVIFFFPRSSFYSAKPSHWIVEGIYRPHSSRFLGIFLQQKIEKSLWPN